MSFRDDDRDLLARILATRPVTDRPNEATVDVIASRLDAPGVRVERMPAHAEGRWNLVAFAGPEPGPDRAGLVLSGHMDVVPPGDGWTSPPFELVERDGRWHGRGTCDMLGFVAMATNLLRRAGAVSLDRPLVLLLSSDEEIGSPGARALVERWPGDRPLPRAAIVGEPTGLRVVRMHKGHAKRRFVLRGRSAHSGTPHLGRSAIEAAGPALVRLAALRRALVAEGGPHAERFPSAPHAVVSVGRIDGGEAVNVVAERCTLDVGVRALPGQEADPLLARVRAAIAAGVADDDAGARGGGGEGGGPDATGGAASAAPVTIEEEDLGENPTLCTPRDAAIVRALMELVGQDEDLGVSYASDGGHLARGLGMEPVLFGPGHMRVAHRPDEHLDPAELDRARTLIAGLAGMPAAGGETGGGGAARDAADTATGRCTQG